MGQTFTLGKTTSVTDRASKALSRADLRGRVTHTAKKVAAPDGSFDTRWYRRQSTFDAETLDPSRPQPSPHRSFSTRVLRQTFAYDWLGNTVTTDDDQHAFYDRSLGDITNDGYQMTGAASASGHLQAEYDAAGFLTSLVVNRTGDCIPAGACLEQRFEYPLENYTSEHELVATWHSHHTGSPIPSTTSSNTSLRSVAQSDQQWATERLSDERISWGVQDPARQFATYVVGGDDRISCSYVASGSWNHPEFLKQPLAPLFK